MHGPSPTVNCSRSAVSAMSELEPSGIRCWAASRRLRPAPSTRRVLATARASRTGNSSGPASCGSEAATSAVSNRSAMLTPDCQGGAGNHTRSRPRWPAASRHADHVRVEAGVVERVLPCGDRALLAEVSGLDAVAALHAALRRSPLPGQRELVPAARTVLVVLDRAPTDADAVRLRDLALDDAPRSSDVPPVELPVVFDGPDLGEVAALTGRPRRVRRDPHALELTVAFGGFAPGFGYLTGLPAELRPAPVHPAHPRAGRVGGAGRGVRRRLSARLAGRLAADRPHRRRPVRRGAEPAGAADPGLRVRFREVR